MGDNLLSRMQRTNDAAVQEAFDAGFNKACDLLALVLNDPSIMGKDVFGEDRIMRVYDGIAKYEQDYRAAWLTAVDSDYLQEKLDQRLLRIFKSGKYKHLWQPFRLRYPAIKQPSYKHSRKGWR